MRKEQFKQLISTLEVSWSDPQVIVSFLLVLAAIVAAALAFKNLQKLSIQNETAIKTLGILVNQNEIAIKTLDTLVNQISSSVGSQTAELFSVITMEYLDRRFKTGKPVEIEGKLITELRVATTKARNIYMKNGRYDLARLEKNSKYIPESDRTTQKGTWENKVAFELSIALNRLGMAVRTDNVDVDFLVAFAADQIIEDWPLCWFWIKTYRGAEENKRFSSSLDGYEHIHYHRRHAEWLVLLSVLWMQNNFNTCPHLGTIQKFYENGINIKDYFIELTLMDREITKNIGKIIKIVGIENDLSDQQKRKLGIICNTA